MSEKALKLQDSLYTINNKTEVNQLRTKFETVEKELQIANLELVNKNQKLEVERSASQKNLFIISLLFVSILALSLFYRYNSKRKFSKKLEKINESLLKSTSQLELAVKERELLLKEIHHRVKNNLQLVMSLLNIQSREGETMNVDAFLEIGKSRIMTLSLIHESLYSTENIGEVDFQNYLENLCRLIFGLDNNTSDRISLEIDTHKVSFDLETAIPLALIVNELLTNSMKYAFPNKNTKGAIKMTCYLGADNLYYFSYTDTGIGFTPKDRSKKSVGITIIELLVMQLDGKLEYNGEKGANYLLCF